MADNGLGVQHLLIVGGARSGKSRFGQARAEESGKRLVFVATARAGDAEMAARIAAHKAARDRRWHVIEEELALAEALQREASPETILLVDCLTLWLNNLLHHGRDLEKEGKRLAQSVGNLAGPAIFISNEVGSGIVPSSELGRRFRDAQGRLNQRMAEACDAVMLVAAGLPLTLKPSLQPMLRL